MTAAPGPGRNGSGRNGSEVDRRLLRWRNAVFVIFWLCGFLFASWASRVPTIRDVLDASTSQMGLLLFGLAVGSVLGLLASSHVIARIGATTAILLCLSLASGGLVLLGLVSLLLPELLILFGALLVLGIGYSVTDVAMNLSGAANERQIGRTLMPIYHAAFSLGTMLGAGLGALLEHLGVSLAVHLVAVGIATLVTTRVAVVYLQPAEHGEKGSAEAEEVAEKPTTGWRSRMAVWREPRILLIGVIVFGMAFAEGSANDWLSLAMVDGYGVPNAGGAAVFGVFVTAMTVGRLVGGRVLDRFGRVPVLRGTAAVAVAGLVLVILGPDVGVAIVGVALWGLGASLGFPVGMSAAADDPRTATASVAAVATIGYFAFLIGPPLIGVLGEEVGLLNALWVVTVLTVLAGLCAPAARNPDSSADRAAHRST